jgi:hypothetical protein
MESLIMKSTVKLLAFLVTLFAWTNVVLAQQSESQLNSITIEQCKDISADVKAEQKRGLVMDVRPFVINQSTGKLAFAHGDGRVSLINMNPFVYNYKVSVAQQELVTTALTDFVKLLLPTGLSSVSGLQTGTVGISGLTRPASRLAEIQRRLGSSPCNDNSPSSQAIGEMYTVFERIKKEISAESKAAQANRANGANGFQLNVTLATELSLFSDSDLDDNFNDYSKKLVALRNEQLETADVCSQAKDLNQTLDGFNLKDVVTSLDTAQAEISLINSLADDLKGLVDNFKGDSVLDADVSKYRCGGFTCVSQFEAYSIEVKAVLGGQGYQLKLNDLRAKTREMTNMLEFTEQLKKKEGMFARSFTFPKKFELSQATITVQREKLTPAPNGDSGGAQSGVVGGQGGSGGQGGAGGQGVVGNAGGVAGTEGSIGNSLGNAVDPSQLAKKDDKKDEKAKTETASNSKPAAANNLTADMNEVIQLGKPRFALSAGLVYSPLPRRTFKSVKGFVLDAQGNPTGTGDKNVIGFEQNSPRRLLPMLFLNSRLWDYGRGSVFFSFGITGKHDDNIDLELVGPSVSFLNDRALFTFGAYGGQTQKLVSDIKIGDEIPDVGDAKLFRKGMTWKPGFSFSYSFSSPKKGERKDPIGGGGNAQVDELKNEIKLGGIPFSLALGLAYTSLEQRTYSPIVGYARDRQGNLTNGQTLTRIVGLSSSSSYRLSPLAMLHTRLTDFGSHDFYFTTGISGKKTDNTFDVEYLLGGSMNVYRRKVFLTLGTYIGKQQTLGGNSFEGSILGTTQPVSTVNRYVWKPAFAFSYDISKIIPRAN